MKHVVKFSSGLSSYEAAKRVAANHGTGNLTLVFTDTLYEHPDNYRFLIEAAANVYGIGGASELAATALSLPGIQEHEIEARKKELPVLSRRAMKLIPGLVWLIDGRTPHEVFFEKRFLGNSRVAKCSIELKRKVADRWLGENCDPASTTVYIGFNFDEQRRIESARLAMTPWHVEFPMDAAPYMNRIGLMSACRERGIQPPILYFFGFKHANCYGGCCQAGQASWAKTHDVLPEIYGLWDRMEQRFREEIKDDESMMTDRRGDGKKKRLTLSQFRERIACGDVDDSDRGSCSCFGASLLVGAA